MQNIDVISSRYAGKFEIKDVIDLYKSNKSIKEIAELFNSSQETISKVLKENNVEVHRRNKINFDEHIFDIIDTEEKAYWLGFIFADGYIATQNKTNYAFELSLQIKDYNHLLKFNNFMKTNINTIKIRNVKYKNGYRKVCRYSISNKHLWETLNNYGCIPRKSLVLKFPDSSIFKYPKLIKDFIRGYWDGDGSLFEVKSRNSYYLCMSVAGTLNFITSIKNYFSGISNEVIHKTGNFYSWKVGYNKARIIATILYSNSTISLDRKYNLYRKHCLLIK